MCTAPYSFHHFPSIPAVILPFLNFSTFTVASSSTEEVELMRSSKGSFGARKLQTLIRCILVLLLAAETVLASSTVRRFRWDVEYVFWSPDCVENMVMAINGRFPGPTIRGKAGDTIVVHLTNKLSTEGVVVHWHGIRQANSSPTSHITVFMAARSHINLWRFCVQLYYSPDGNSVGGRHCVNLTVCNQPRRDLHL